VWESNGYESDVSLIRDSHILQMCQFTVQQQSKASQGGAAGAHSSLKTNGKCLELSALFIYETTKTLLFII
jgi:hypothetical protein